MYLYDDGEDISSVYFVFFFWYAVRTSATTTATSLLTSVRIWEGWAGKQQQQR